MLIRLNKFLADSGISSRRGADDIILSGKVTVNGQIVREMGLKVDPETDEIKYDGKIYQGQGKMLYYALYKPIKVVSTAKDPRNRSRVIDFVPTEPRVYPVGRLDYDSEGLIIITNDGELTNKLTHPSFEHEKEYEVVVYPMANHKIRSHDEIKNILAKGLEIEGHIMKADSAKIVHQTGDSIYSTLKLVLHTGYNRQIRKMCAKIGLEVVKLTRTRIGRLKLADLELKSGEFKIINKNQIL